MKVQWLQRFTNDRQDSVWYGGDIVAINVNKRYQVIIGAYGDIRARIKDDYYADKNNGGMFAEYLEENGIYNDKDLQIAVENGDIEWEDNNWFEAVIWDDKEKDYVNSWDTVIDELDANDDFSWIKPWLKEIVD